MNINTLFASNALNIVFTIIAISIVLLLLFLEKIFFKHKMETLHKFLVFIIYISNFIIAVAVVFFILFIWDYDLLTYLETLITNATSTITSKIGSLVSSLLVIFFSMLLMRITKMSLLKVGKKESPQMKRKQTIAKVVNSIVKYLVTIIALLVVLAIWGVNVAPALAGLGILGLVIGLGAQKFINDLISGFFIVFEHHFDVGDKIEVQGFKGDVIDIGLKTTRIRNWKGDTKIVSNGEISTLINYSRHFSVAIVEFGIAYQEDAQKTIDLLTLELPKVRKDFPMIIEDPQVLGVIELANSSVNLRVIAKTLPEEHYAVEREIRKRIKEILDANDIEIPFPQVVINQPKERETK
ncbi:MAG: mechanosensitive ion channel family protein [Acholeplasmataceae bacterium]|nr:mechanosensitive ion channel family protein [Acholeplasmataceae bacterium]